MDMLALALGGGAVSLSMFVSLGVCFYEYVSEFSCLSVGGCASLCSPLSLFLSQPFLVERSKSPVVPNKNCGRA